jgi:beta-galactosidase
VPAQVWERRLRLLKEAGANAIRMAHNPHMPELYDLCDRMGLLVQDEAFDEWELPKNKWVEGWNVGAPGHDGTSAHFAAWAEADLADMVRSHRNHPSVIMWSIGNEIDYPNDPYSHEVLDESSNPQSFGFGFKPEHPHASALTPIAQRLAAVVRRHDPTRPVTAGLAAALIANEVGLADALDVAGYNYQEYRYAEDHARYPGRALYGSENGMQLQFWQAVIDHDFVAGQFLWTGIDYLGEAGKWPARSNGAGLLDLAGFRKPEFYYRQSIWTGEPMIYIGTAPAQQPGERTTLWSHKQAAPVWEGMQGEPFTVRCFTNCASAELLLNGRSLGVQRRDEAQEGVLLWEVPFEPGALTVVGMAEGEALCRFTLQTSGPLAALDVAVDRPTLCAAQNDLAHIAVTAVDAERVPVYGADAPVSWHVEGPARLLGVESGDHQSHEPYQAAERRLFHGRQLGYLQATGEAGAVRVTLTAPGLPPVTLPFDAI